MTRMGWRGYALLAGLVVLAGLVTLVVSQRGYLSEGFPFLRSEPEIALPGDRPFSEGRVAPGQEDRAGAAQAVLEDHLATIGMPALSVAVAVDGEIAWSGALGYADVDAGRAAGPQTLFRIGSTSKAVTATLFARMVDAGLVDPDAPVSAYLDDLPNPDWADITLRQLASHTAGIVGYEENRDLGGLWSSMRLQRHYGDATETLDLFDGSDLLFEPGTDFHYSSYDIQLLAAVLQTVGGAPYPDLVDEWVRGPLGIDTPRPDAETPERAEFYHVSPRGTVQRWRAVDLSSKLAGGGFMARPEDLARMGAAWLEDGFISPQTREMFWTPQTLADGSVNEQSYALGWRRNEGVRGVGDDLVYVHHGGVSKGAMSWLVVVPEKRMAISMMINGHVWPFGDWAGVYGDLVRIFDPETEDQLE
ncbi:serine hydrolase domain-containing protein [Maricaulis sp.]|uniref:serine hydrolase domain-containing protein n=1 Tax=Maricaulis sp. TaxID=1486257 RepID=UPI002605A078|nr:serine hydrolase domain-containing protein [Maricaulis sp.]